MSSTNATSSAPVPTTGPPFIANKTIVIAGAGISGLALAISLRKQWLTATTSSSGTAFSPPKILIFERDTYDSRIGREGYTLSLRTDIQSGGIQALDRMGLYESVRDASVTATRETGADGEAGNFVLWDAGWGDMMRIASLPVIVGDKELRSCRVRRNALQRVLADAVVGNGDEIHWGTEVLSVRHAVNEEIGAPIVSVSRGTEIRCDLLVAADGARSKIRGILRPEDAELDFAGVFLVSGTAKYERKDLVPKPLDRDWGLVLGGGKGKGVGLFCAPVDSCSAVWALSRPAKEPREHQKRHPLSKADVDALLTEARNLGQGFPKRLESLIDATDPSTLMLCNAMDRPPFAHDPAEKYGPVVWIGDSNHAVSPFAGNGANMALMDGWDLAASLLRPTQSFGEVLNLYDSTSMKRAGTTLKMSRWAIDVAHSTGWKLNMYLLFIRVLGFFIGGWKDVRFGVKW